MKFNIKEKEYDLNELRNLSDKNLLSALTEISEVSYLEGYEDGLQAMAAINYLEGLGYTNDDYENQDGGGYEDR